MAILPKRRHGLPGVLRWTSAVSSTLIAGLLLLSSAIAEQADMPDFLDFDTLQRPSSPNHWLVAPANSDLAARADDLAPILPMSAPELVTAWIAVVEAQPRTRVLGVSDDGLQVEAEQRSALFGFVDRVSFRAVPIEPDNQSSFLAYSRSQLGYWDLGVNHRRLNDWIGQLSR